MSMSCHSRPYNYEAAKRTFSVSVDLFASSTLGSRIFGHEPRSSILLLLQRLGESRPELLIRQGREGWEGRFRDKRIETNMSHPALEFALNNKSRSDLVYEWSISELSILSWHDQVSIDWHWQTSVGSLDSFSAMRVQSYPRSADTCTVKRFYRVQTQRLGEGQCPSDSRYSFLQYRVQHTQCARW